MHREELAKELVQDVFLKIWTSRSAVTGIENIEAFLYTVARNLALSRLKRMAHEKQILAEIRKGTDEALTSDEVLHRDYHRILQKAIANLPEQQKNVYILSREKGMSRQEIADTLGISTNTVKAHLSAATNSLRGWFNRHKGEMLTLFIILHGIR